MVAPNYALKRRELAKKSGLGRRPRVVEAPAPASKPSGPAPRPRLPERDQHRPGQTVVRSIYGHERRAGKGLRFPPSAAALVRASPADG